MFNTMKIRSILLFSIFSCGQVLAQSGPLTSNTPTGEEPNVIAERRDDAEFKKMTSGGSLNALWTTYRLDSDSKKPERLKLPLDRETGLEVRLSPKDGTLNFEKKDLQQTFVIANKAGDKTSQCPNYDIYIKDASKDFAFLRKDCHLYEYQPQKSYKSVEYYLYDLQAKTMWQIWLGAGDSSTPFPLPYPEPTMKKIQDGFALNWTASNPADTGAHKTPIRMNTKYVRITDPATHEVRLECSDLTASKEERHGGACEGFVIRANP
jgi:hypothetical protein